MIKKNEDKTTESEIEIRYFSVTQKKLVVMTFLTFGLYQFVWFYNNWIYIKFKYNLKIWPFWRAVFSPITSYGVFNRVSKAVQAETNSSTFRNLSPIALSVTYFTTPFVAFDLPNFYWLLYMLSVISVMVSNQQIIELNLSKNRSFVPEKINWINLIYIVPVCMFLFVCIIGLLFPHHKT